MSFSFSIKKAANAGKPGASAGAAAAKGAGAPRGAPLSAFREALEAEEEREKQEASRPTLSTFAAKPQRREKERLEELLKANPDALAYDEVYDQVSSGTAKEQQMRSQSRRLYLGYTEDIKEKIAKDAATADALAADAVGGPQGGSQGGPSPTPEATGKGSSPPPRFIGKLLVQAQRRQIEREIIQERQLQKEREREGGAADEVFVTAAYRQRLEERRLIQQELEMREARDAARAADKQKDLSSFHAYLLRSGAATRSAAAASAAPATHSSLPSAAAAAAPDAAAAAPAAAAAASPAAAPRLKPEGAKGAAVKLEPSSSTQQQQQQQQAQQQQQQQEQQKEEKSELPSPAAPRSSSSISPVDKEAVLPFNRAAERKLLPVPERLTRADLAKARARYLQRKKQKTETEEEKHSNACKLFEEGKQLTACVLVLT
ncbi:hypothetical protein Efla_002797 [Eimeria flavescens]